MLTVISPGPIDHLLKEDLDISYLKRKKEKNNVGWGGVCVTLKAKQCWLDIHGEEKS